MKTFSGTFANGDKYMGVEANEEGFDHEVYKTNCPNGFYYLGKYHTKGEIDFSVSEDWVAPHDSNEEYYDYQYSGDPHPNDGLYDNSCDTIEQSLLSLLDRDSRQAFPLEENTSSHPSDINPTSRAHFNKLEEQWRESEQQVRPKTFLIILVK